MTTFDNWHLPDGVKIWAAPRLRQPHIELHERDGPLRVVLLADYEALLAQFEDALRLIEHQQLAHAEASTQLTRAARERGMSGTALT